MRPFINPDYDCMGFRLLIGKRAYLWKQLFLFASNPIWEMKLQNLDITESY